MRKLGKWVLIGAIIIVVTLLVMPYPFYLDMKSNWDETEDTLILRVQWAGEFYQDENGVWQVEITKETVQWNYGEDPPDYWDYWGSSFGLLSISDQTYNIFVRLYIYDTSTDIYPYNEKLEVRTFDIDTGWKKYNVGQYEEVKLTLSAYAPPGGVSNYWKTITIQDDGIRYTTANCPKILWRNGVVQPYG